MAKGLGVTMKTRAKNKTEKANIKQIIARIEQAIAENEKQIQILNCLQEATFGTQIKKLKRVNAINRRQLSHYEKNRREVENMKKNRPRKTQIQDLTKKK